MCGFIKRARLSSRSICRWDVRAPFWLLPLLSTAGLSSVKRDRNISPHFFQSDYLLPNRSGGSILCSCAQYIIFLSNINLFISGDSVLHPEMALEELGGGQGVRAQDGPQPRHHIRRGEETEEKTAYRLSLLESEASQLLGLPILLLWIPGSPKCLG